MAILNYTTSITTEKTASEIQKRLAMAKAQAILCEYDDSGIMSSISFRIETPHGLMMFKLPVNVDGVLNALKKGRRVPSKSKTKEQAAKVAMRILKDWVEAQLAIVEAEMADIAEVFFPYAQGKGGLTVYETMKQGGFLTLTHGKED